MVRLQLLGSLGLTSEDGQEIRPVLAQPKRFALLAYLSLAEPRGFRRRDSLLPLFWPETAGEPARASLRRTLHFLRSHLGDGVIVTRGEEEIDVAADQLTSDARAFFDHIAAGRDADALALYRGDLLAGFFVSDAAPELDEWIDQTRRRYRETAFAAAERLCDQEEAGKRLSTARFWAARALELQPLSERALGRLLRLLDAAGERVEALRRYDEFEKRLSAELNVEPGPELRTLVKNLRERRPTPSATAAPPPPPPPPPPPSRADSASWSSPATPRRHVHVRWWPAAAVLALALAVWGLASRHSSPTPVLAVGALVAQSPTDSANIGATLPQLIATGLGNVRDVQVISRARLYEVSGDLDGGDALTPAALLRAAKLAGADRLVEGEIYPQSDTSGGGWRVDLRLVDLGSGAVRRSWVVHGRDPFAVADSATARLAAELRRPMPETGVAEIAPTSLMAQRYFDDGLKAYYRRDYAAADALFGLAINEDSTYVLALYYAVQTRAQLGTPITAVRALARRTLALTERTGGGPAGANRYGRLLMRTYWAMADQTPGAVAVADSLITAFPLEVEGYSLAGSAHWLAADYPGQLRLYRRLAELDSAAIAAGGRDCRACLAIEGMLSAYSAMDSVPQQFEMLRWLRRVQPTNAGALPSEFFLLAGLGRAAEARQTFEIWVDSLNPTPIDAANQAAREALVLGDFAEADRQISVLSSLSGMQKHGGYWLEVLRDRMQGKQTDALAAARAYERESIHDPDTRLLGTSRLLRGLVLLDMGRSRAGAAVFDSIRQRWVLSDTSIGQAARQHTWMLTHVVTGLAAAGDTARVALLVDTLQRVGARSGYARDQRMYHYARGLLWDARGRPADAIAEYRQALTSPTFGFTRINYRLAQDLVATSQPREAIPLLSAALRGGLEASNLYITHTELHELLARAYDAAGKRDSAVLHYRWVANAWRDGDAPFRERARAAEAKTRTAP